MSPAVTVVAWFVALSPLPLPRAAAAASSMVKPFC